MSTLLEDASYLATFSLVIVHNLSSDLLESLSKLLWSDPSLPPLIAVRSAGFLADFYIQIHEHTSRSCLRRDSSCIYAHLLFTVIDSHPDNAPSLRIDKPFPALLEHAMKLDFDQMDVTDHGHIPYVIILVRAMQNWKTSVSECDCNFMISGRNVLSSMAGARRKHMRRRTSSRSQSSL